MQYITSEEEGEVQVKVSLQSSLDLIRESISGTFSVSLSYGGTAVGKWILKAHSTFHINQVYVPPYI